MFTMKLMVFDVPREVILKLPVLSDMMTCVLTNRYQLFIEAYYVHLQGNSKKSDWRNCCAYGSNGLHFAGKKGFIKYSKVGFSRIRTDNDMIYYISMLLGT
jgi:hypothetical protein